MNKRTSEMPTSDSEDNIPCKTPSPRSSASQAPPNPRHNADDPSPRINFPTPPAPATSSHPFRGLSRKFMSKKESSDHRRGKSEGFNNFDPRRGVYESPNVRDRVRRWQAAGGGVVTPGDVVEVPPICPTTPTPSIRRGVVPSEYGAASSIASQLRSPPDRRRSTLGGGVPVGPLSPPRAPAMVNDWESASDAEKEAQRKRASSRDRERKMRRKTRGSRGDSLDLVSGGESPGVTPVKSAATPSTAIPLKEPFGDDVIRVAPTPVSAADTTKSLADDGIRVTPAINDNDGIRVAPVKVRRRGSGTRRKKRNKESKASVEEKGKEPDSASEVVDIKATLAMLDKKSEAEPETETEVTKLDARNKPTESLSQMSSNTRTKAWEDDGIRIYTLSPVKSDRTARMNSVRQSARSVRSRKEEFEAQMRKEKKAKDEFAEMVRKQEEEERMKTPTPKVPPIEPPTTPATLKSMEGSTIIGDAESSKMRYDDYDDGIRVRPVDDDGIRVRPLKTKKNNRRKTEGLPRKRSQSLHQSSLADMTDSMREADEFDDPPVTPKPSDIKRPYCTESAPATPTGRTRMRRDTEPRTPFSVKERAKRLELGLEPLEATDEAPKSAPKLQEEQSRARSPGDIRRVRGPRPPDHSPSRDLEKRREARREERRLARQALKEAEEERIRVAARLAKAKEDQRRERERERGREAAERTREKPPAPVASERVKTATPEVPPRPKRERRKTVTEAIMSSFEVPQKKELREKAKSAQSTPFSSTDSLPLKKEKLPIATGPPALDRESRNSSHSTAPSDSLSLHSDSTQKTSPLTRESALPLKKKKDPLAPKLASATSSFFKALKEEFQATSARVVLDSRQSSEDEASYSSSDEDEVVESTVKGTPKKSTPRKLTPKKSMAQRREIVRRATSSEESDTDHSSTESSSELDSESGSDSESESVSHSENEPVKPTPRAKPNSEIKAKPKSKAPVVKQLDSDSESVSASESLPAPSTEWEKEPVKAAPKVKSSSNIKAKRSLFEPVSQSSTEPEKEPVKSARKANTNSKTKAKTKVKARPKALLEKEPITAPEKERPQSKTAAPEPMAEVVSSQQESPQLPEPAPGSAPEPVPEPKPEPVPEAVPELAPEPKAATVPQKAEDRRTTTATPEPLRKRRSSRRKASGGRRKSPVQENSSSFVKPRRHIRGTTAPPRPKSIISRRGSDASLTPTSSVCGDSALASENGPTRNVSDASTVKPLRVRKSTYRQLDVAEPSSILTEEPKVMAPAVEPAVPQEDPEDWYNPDVSVMGTDLKRRYTKHADLISILSVPRSSRGHKSQRSHRSTSHSRQVKGRKVVETLKIPDLMKELGTDEARYMRELRVMVEDVVPVLFQTVLGRADDDLRRTASTSSTTTSTTVNSRSTHSGFSSNPTRPIVDMGITLERLKTLHERLPMQDVDQLMAWAGDAKRVYEEYLSVWRMGFQDVVVTMPPADGDEDADLPGISSKDAKIRKELEILHGTAEGEASTKYEGDPSTWAMPPPPRPMAEDEVEDEKVDVAFLLKRPLVRLKALAKLFKRINIIRPSQIVECYANQYHSLIAIARKKISDEKARIEDEAAASLDTSRVCDLHLLHPRPDIPLDQNRHVKARDAFSMRIYHSSGRLIKISIELILRDPAPRSRYSEAEVLIVEIGEGSTKWLLFPPIPISLISARTGDAAGEIVVMVRGLDQELQEWREVMALSSMTAAGFEWVQMLGLLPIPPEGPFRKEQHEPTYLETVIEESIVSSRVQAAPISPLQAHERSLSPQALPAQDQMPSSGDVRRSPDIVQPNQPPIVISTVNPFLYLETDSAEHGEPTAPDLESSKAALPPVESSLTQQPAIDSAAEVAATVACTPEEDLPPKHTPSKRSIQRSRRRAAHSALAKESPSPEPELTIETNLPVNTDDDVSSEDETTRPSVGSYPPLFKNDSKLSLDNIPDLSPKPAKSKEPAAEGPPPVPPHRSSTPSPPQSPAAGRSPPASTRSGFGGRRRTSSPLKHEYDPSSPSDSGSESGAQAAEVSEFSEVEEVVKPAHSERFDSVSSVSSSESSYQSSSESSSEEDSDDAVSLCSEEEDGEYPIPMLSIPRRVSRQPSGMISVPRQRPSSVSLASSTAIQEAGRDEASEAATVRPNTAQEPEFRPPPIPQQLPQPISYKFRAHLYKWGVSSWEALHPGQGIIVITPGHVEAFPLLNLDSPATPRTPQDPSMPNSQSQSNLDTMLTSQEAIFSFELTPDTPVNRGTVVDMTIRCPKTSSLRGQSIMLRSRSIQECSALFNTVIAHQVYPAGYMSSSTLLTAIIQSDMGDSTTSLGRSNSIKRGFAWSRGKTYRAGTSTATLSLISSPSETSVGSISSAFSRLRVGLFKNSSLSSMASSSSTNDSSRGGTPAEVPIPGIKNPVVVMAPMKIRLYKRETASKWRDLGGSRLNVIKPPDQSNYGPYEKRIIITNKKGDSILLDEVLGEAAFERVARTGVAINIIAAEGDQIADFGGIGSKNRVYMMQMKGEAETAYTFSILGKLRY